MGPVSMKAEHTLSLEIFNYLTSGGLANLPFGRGIKEMITMTRVNKNFTCNSYKPSMINCTSPPQKKRANALL